MMDSDRPPSAGHRCSNADTQRSGYSCVSAHRLAMSWGSVQPVWLGVAVVSIEVGTELNCPLVMRERRCVQCRVNKRSSVGVGYARWRGEGHSVSPIRRCFRMNAAQDYPSLAGRSFDDSGSPVGILAHNGTPAGKLRPILPVMLDCRRADTGNRYSGLVDASVHLRVKAEPHARRKIQTVVGGISGQKSSSTDSKVVQTTLHGIVNVRGCARHQAVADGDEVSTGNNQQTIGHEP